MRVDWDGSSGRNSSASEDCVRARETERRGGVSEGTMGVVTLGYREVGFLVSLSAVGV